MAVSGVTEKPVWCVDSWDMLQEGLSAVLTTEKVLDPYGWTMCPAQEQRPPWMSVDTMAGDNTDVVTLKMQALCAIMSVPQTVCVNGPCLVSA